MGNLDMPDAVAGKYAVEMAARAADTDIVSRPCLYAGKIDHGAHIAVGACGVLEDVQYLHGSRDRLGGFTLGSVPVD